MKKSLQDSKISTVVLTAVKFIKHQKTKRNYGLMSLLIYCLSMMLTNAQTINPVVYTPDNGVRDLEAKGDTLTIAGNFHHVGKYVGGIAQVTTTSDQINPSFPKMEDEGVISLTNDGVGGYYALDYNGYISHILANHTFESGFKILATNGTVQNQNSKIIYHNGILYVGLGENFTLSGTDYGFLTAYDVTTQQIIPTVPKVNGSIHNLRLEGSNLYIIGSFDSVAGELRNQIACINLSNQTLSGWYPQIPQPQYNVPGFDDIVFHGNNAIIGGYFSNSGYPADIAKCIVVDKSTGVFVKFLFYGGGIFGDPLNNIYWAAGVQRMAVSNNTLFVATNGTYDTRLTAYNLLADSNGVIWARFFNYIATVSELLVSGNTVYVAGHGYLEEVFEINKGNGDVEFIELADAKNAVAFDINTGAIADWHPDPVGLEYNNVKTMLLDGNKIILGGYFSHLNGMNRTYVYQYNSLTDEVLPFSIQMGAFGSINQVKLIDSTLYFAGGFDSSGSGNNYLTTRAYNIYTGQKLDWYPDYLGEARAIEVNNQYVFLGGRWGHLNDTTNGIEKVNLVAIDRTTGKVANWAPNPSKNMEVRSLHLSNGILYVGGNFDSIAGQYRENIAAFDASTLQLLAWTADSLGEINTIKSNDSFLFVTQPHNMWSYDLYGFARLRKTNGDLVAKPNDSKEFGTTDLAVRNNTVLVGSSNHEGYDTAFCSIRAFSGDSISMGRDFDVCMFTEGYARSIELIRTDLYFAGEFKSVNHQLLGSNLVRMSFPVDYFDVKQPVSVPFAQNYEDAISVYPNPATELFTVKFHNKNQTRCSLSMLDITGRIVSEVTITMPDLDTFEVDTRNLTSGVYFITISDKDKQAYSVQKLVISK